MPSGAPIGLFDSGVGGLSVALEVRRLLPGEDLLYFADSAYCPYGTKSPETIRERARLISEFLLSREAKMLVIASNTTSTAALEYLRGLSTVPVVGVEPAVKPAAAETRNGRVGVLATGVTLTSDRFSSLVQRFGNGIEVYTQPCPGLVELVEQGVIEGPEAEEMLRRYLGPLLEHDCDTIVLGCTHYPFLKPLVEKNVGQGVVVLDTSSAIANQVVRVAAQHDLAANQHDHGCEVFYTSGNPEITTPVIRRLWGREDVVVELVDL